MSVQPAEMLSLQEDHQCFQGSLLNCLGSSRQLRSHRAVVGRLAEIPAKILQILMIKHEQLVLSGLSYEPGKAGYHLLVRQFQPLRTQKCTGASQFSLGVGRYLTVNAEDIHVMAIGDPGQRYWIGDPVA